MPETLGNGAMILHKPTWHGPPRHGAHISPGIGLDFPLKVLEASSPLGSIKLAELAS